MKIAVDRKALEINRRITDRYLHHPPILVKDDNDMTTRLHEYLLPPALNWRVIYEPDPKKVWTEIGDDGESVSFNVWIESID